MDDPPARPRTFRFGASKYSSFNRAVKELPTKAMPGTGPLTAFIAFHLGAELVQRHSAEHRDPLAEHLERHPNRALLALATDPGITFGLELGNGAVVCHPRIKARSKRERTSFRPRSIPGA